MEPAMGDRPILDDASDGFIAARAADGDPAAFVVLVRRHGPMMRAFARRTLGASDEVDDVVQETFITAWQRLPELADPAKVKSWLMRIVSRKAVDRIRARRAEASIDDEDQGIDMVDDREPSSAVELNSEVAALDAALRALPDTQRTCWVLREIGGYSYEEVAAELDIPVSTVRGLLARARQHVLVRMEGWR